MTEAHGIALTEKLAAISREKYKLKVSPDWRIGQFYKFLKISPSYELARLASLGKLKPEVPLPTDFDVVKKTYADFGDVRETEFWDWWIKRAQFQFDISMAVEPAASLIMEAGIRQRVSNDTIREGQAALKEYWKAQRADEGLPASLVLAIPLDGDSRKILKRVAEIVDRFHDNKTKRSGGASYELIHDKTRKATLVTAMRVLRARAALPHAPLYVLGNKTKIQHAFVTDEKVTKRLGNIRDQRRRMEILTSRHLHRAYLFAENAARRKFPSLDPLPNDPHRPRFDPLKLNREHRAMIKWTEATLKKRKKQLLVAREKA